MTKYVLNSGGLREDSEKASKYFEELLKGKGKNPNVLLCFFAEPRGTWNTKFEKYKPVFQGYISEDISPSFVLALPDNFSEQVQRADIIYCHGGDSTLAMYWYKRLDAFNLWKNKSVGTNSATTAMLCASHWICDWRELMDGFGILPIKTVVHFNSKRYDSDPRGPIDWKKAKQDLAEYGDKSLPIYALEEGEFVVFEV